MCYVVALGQITNTTAHQCRGPAINMTLTQSTISQISQDAVTQTWRLYETVLMSWGVAEAVGNSQGANRIVVELPGVQDTAEAKRVIGRTANLEFRMVSDQTILSKPIHLVLPAGTESLPFGQSRQPAKTLLEIKLWSPVETPKQGWIKTVALKGNITLITQGGRLMQNTTKPVETNGGSLWK